MVEVEISRSLRKKPSKKSIEHKHLHWYRAKKYDDVFIVLIIRSHVVYFGTDSGFDEGDEVSFDDTDVIKDGGVVLLEDITNCIKITIEEDDC